jgi:pseudouridine-5'-phosphate glycosidase/pseudouridine kinase
MLAFTRNLRSVAFPTRVVGLVQRQSQRCLSSRPPAFVLSPAVRSALASGRPVVALESTIISHGMPWPENLECAQQVEDVVRSRGAEPATIAILDGTLHIGLEPAHLERLARAGTNARKCSRRDLAVVAAARLDGATTVSGTMIGAHMAGIHVFATGGLGGVHRGSFTDDTTLDVSADLTELGRTPVCVVCAGVKSILDVPRTLEYLETQGVPVLAYQTDNFPDFFTPDSGLPAPARVDSAGDVAGIIAANQGLGLTNGIVVAVPNPAPAPKELVQGAVDQAVREAMDAGIKGRDMTPFLLKRVNELTGGSSLTSNVALVKHNARIAADIAVEHSKLMGGGGGTTGDEAHSNPSDVGRNDESGGIVVVGGACIDVQAKGALMGNTSVPGTVHQSLGGVGRNIAECIARMRSAALASGVSDPGASTGVGAPKLVTCVGKDMSGDNIIRGCDLVGIDTSLVQRSDTRQTATYVAMIDEGGEMTNAVADMDIISELDAEVLSAMQSHIAAAPLVVADGNLSVSTLKSLCAIGKASGTPVLFEPVSVPKVAKAVDVLDSLTMIKPNSDELMRLCELVGVPTHDEAGVIQERFCALEIASRMLPNDKTDFAWRRVFVTRGPSDVIHAKARWGPMGLREAILDTFPVAKLSDSEILSVTGAGDSFVGVLCWAAATGVPMDEAIRQACSGARMSLQSSSAIASDFAELVRS